jgi:hypothetical protein
VSAQAWVLLASAVVPVFVAIGIYWFGLKWARRSDEQERARRAESDEL